ncbi:MAG: hypothetical protein FJ031_05025 [Chloroflexi bacterium]|nr:hypothetical protein [Chloroflexota bacterium]
MKRQKILIRVLDFFLIGILIGGCTFPVTTSDEFDVFFGRPSSGDVIMVGETFDLLANCQRQLEMDMATIRNAHGMGCWECGGG